MPKAEAVIDQFVEATGGKAAYEKFKSRTLRHDRGPGRQRHWENPDLSGCTQETRHRDGDWSRQIDPGNRRNDRLADLARSRRLMDAAEKDDFLRDATFNAEIHSKDLYEKLECVGVEDVEGKPAYKVVLTAKTGKKETEYYDKSSHLLVKETTTTKGPMGDVLLESILSDYKRVDGLLMPFTIIQKIEGQQFVIKFTEVKHDADIPADTFRKPASLDDAEKKKAD